MSGVRPPFAWRTVPALAAGVLATLVGALAVLLLPLRGARRRVAVDAILRVWARFWCLVTGARIEVEGLDRLEPSATYVVVSNHTSNLDPMVHLAVFGGRLRILAKRELFRVPLLGPALRAAGIVEVNRDRADQTAINQGVADAFGSGSSLLVYPEGTFSDEGGMREFKPGAFMIAVTHGVPVVPVALRGVDGVWSVGRWRIRPGVVRVTIGRPLVTKDLTPADVRALSAEARDVIAAALETPPQAL
ncbi:lysophospholipid acyltransferase family protein [Actinocorallia sp. A-T 12471]|uniref:lysophospholipid acyltransferase family protein n=1 Tax=Actinocorallia sp. A-T 12471 TaxID=3089813 RepID=UPI0029CEF04D|nr:lysophospholipid acyltransferase family protein [Actinocorallia sp. A-T 12471]MDX6744857.1 lysophospholipid acyltransferase family protein [Actinocorallia sp. A-T 12471]